MLDNQLEFGETMHPTVTFTTDPQKDTSKITAFLCRPDPVRDGINFPGVIYSRLPGLKDEIGSGGIDAAVRDYIDRYYQNQRSEIDKQLVLINTDWQTVAAHISLAWMQFSGIHLGHIKTFEDYIR